MVSSSRYPGTCSVADMPIVMQYIATNKQADVIDALRYVNRRGFLHVEASALLSSDVTDWKRPLEKRRSYQIGKPCGMARFQRAHQRMSTFAMFVGRNQGSHFWGRSMTLAQTDTEDPSKHPH